MDRELEDLPQDLPWREWIWRIEAVLFASATPVSRDGLRDLFDKDISRDLIGRLAAQGLIGRGPRSPKRGSAFTYVTTERFLTVFGLESLRDLDEEALADAALG
jgi:segregation and condensation protein B